MQVHGKIPDGAREIVKVKKANNNTSLITHDHFHIPGHAQAGQIQGKRQIPAVNAGRRPSTGTTTG